MKKKRFTTLCILLCMLMSVLCSAPYSMALTKDFEGGLQVDIPDGWEETQNDSKNVIFHAENRLSGLELGIYTKRNLKLNKTNTWLGLTEDELKKMADTTIEAQDSDQASISTWSSCKNDQMQYLVFTGTVKTDAEENKDEIMNFEQYCTVVNGGTLQFTFYKYEPFTEDDRTVMQTVALSAHYDELREEASLDKDLKIKLGVTVLVLVLLLWSVFWDIKRYKNKIKKEAEQKVSEQYGKQN